MTILLAYFAAIGLAVAAVLVDLWNGLKAGLRSLASLGPPQPAPRPQLAARTPRDPRQALDPADPANACLLGTCPVCGMHDPERFELGVSTVTWRGWPAHDTCVAWLGDSEPLPASGAAVALRRRPLPGGPSVQPAGGMYVTGTLPGYEWTARLQPASSLSARLDAVCALGHSVSVITGTPGLEPRAPDIPAGWRLLATVSVLPGCTEIQQCMITDQSPRLKPEQPSWSVAPGAGMSVCITARLAGSTHRALAVLKAADAAFPRTDLICWHSPARYDLTLLAGDPALLATPPAVPPGAEIVAWIGIPARCTQITPAMIRCALPSELPGLR